MEICGPCIRRTSSAESNSESLCASQTDRSLIETAVAGPRDRHNDFFRITFVGTKRVFKTARKGFSPFIARRSRTPAWLCCHPFQPHNA